MIFPKISIAGLAVAAALTATAATAIPTPSPASLDTQTLGKLVARPVIPPLTGQQRSRIAGSLMKTQTTPVVGVPTSLSIDRLSANGRYLTYLYPIGISHSDTGVAALILNGGSETQVNIEGGGAGKSFLVDCRVSDDLEVTWYVDGAGVTAKGTTNAIDKHLSFLVQTLAGKTAVLHIESQQGTGIYGMFINYGCDVTQIG
ncbi:hypothetical protein [Asticcacaulis benevestitus]|uniref:Ig-like domain-containing protein n=1 Tax=Asticcacaulis benevestitus DSM 16100 = ATCC BAA-896 TaxID=1121022 RepID=V4PQA6_9CAUL|nr:hypothetical protein [Asticcacaulis benevestitus]ESQ90481.1 hypothetical protein ABENE_12220 [Asticcacaulis benevestitus DSM 16100 = ATCC BAA-896]